MAWPVEKPALPFIQHLLVSKRRRKEAVTCKATRSRESNWQVKDMRGKARGAAGKGYQGEERREAQVEETRKGEWKRD